MAGVTRRVAGFTAVETLFRVAMLDAMISRTMDRGSMILHSGFLEWLLDVIFYPHQEEKGVYVDIFGEIFLLG